MWQSKHLSTFLMNWIKTPKITIFQVLEVAEDLLKRSHTCKTLEEKRVDMFPKEGAKMSKDAKDFLERLKKLRGTITDLDDQINKEFEKYSGDVRYFAEYQTGLQDFYPRLVEAEERITEGLVTPKSLVESENTLTDTKSFQTSLEELIKVLENAGEIAKKMSHHDHSDITVASFRIRWESAHKVIIPQPLSPIPRPQKCGFTAWRSSSNAGTIWNKRLVS